MNEISVSFTEEKHAPENTRCEQAVELQILWNASDQEPLQVVSITQFHVILQCQKKDAPNLIKSLFSHTICRILVYFVIVSKNTYR